MRSLVLFVLLTLPLNVSGKEIMRASPWVLHSSFWMSLHETLIADAMQLTPREFNKLSGEELSIWNDAVTAYRTVGGQSDLAFAKPMIVASDSLTQVADDATQPMIEGPLAEALKRAAPVYRAQWWEADDKANRFFITYGSAMLGEVGEDLMRAHETVYRSAWPTRVLVYVSPYAGPSGAYTIIGKSGGVITTMSSRDPAYQGLRVLEMLFHESSHAVVGPNTGTLGLAISAAQKQLGFDAPRDLWHAILFATSGELTRQVLAERGVTKYVPFSEGLFKKYRVPIEKYWIAYVNGEGTLESAIMKIVSAIHDERADRSTSPVRNNGHSTGVALLISLVRNPSQLNSFRNIETPWICSVPEPEHLLSQFVVHFKVLINRSLPEFINRCQMKELAGQVAIVTGAASGIGRELAKQLSASGCRLALVDIDETALKGLWHELDSKRSAISLHAIDIADEDAVTQTVDDVNRTHGRISILINNAGISISAPFQEVRFEDFHRLIATNFWGSVYLCHCTLPFLRREKEASIVNVLSGFASLGFPNKTAYCSSKAALLGFSKALYTELYGTPVKVSVVIPPAVDTNFIRKGVAYDEIKRQREIVFIEKRGVPVDRVARKIIRGMLKGRFIIRIGLMPRAIDLIGGCFPAATHKLLARNKFRIDFV